MSDICADTCMHGVLLKDPAGQNEHKHRSMQQCMQPEHKLAYLVPFRQSRSPGSRCCWAH